MDAVIVIPARYASSRFPAKPLALIGGVSLIERVHRRALTSKRASAVWVATDHATIEQHVRDFGGNVVMTSERHESGSDRIAEAVARIEQERGARFDIVVNVQGDEPLIDIERVDAMIETLAAGDAGMATLASPFESEDEFLSRDVVKVVTDLSGHALYFSRSPIPYGDRHGSRRHVGVYAYRREALDQFTRLPRSPLEIAESLEQLRALQNGIRIAVLPTMKSHLGIDRPEDVARVERELELLEQA